MRPALVMAASALLTTAALADPAAERALDGAAITAALTGATVAGATVAGADWTQRFGASGHTRYEREGRAEQGRWRVEADRYCSQWPPREAWSCYAMATRVEPDGAAVVIWIDAAGARTEARITEPGPAHAQAFAK